MCGPCPFTAVGSALHAAAGVVAAPFSAVGVGVVLPVLLRLAFVLSFTLLLIGWVPPFLMRLVWTFDILRLWYLLPFLLQQLWTPPSILLLGWMLPLFFPAVGGHCPFLLMLTLILYTAVSICCLYTSFWVGAALFCSVSADAAPFLCCCRHGCCHYCCCLTETRPYILFWEHRY